MYRANEHGDQEQHFQVFGLWPQECEQQQGDSGKADAREENRRHADIGNNPSRDDDVEAPDKAHGEQENKIAKGHALAVSRIYPGWAGGLGLSLAGRAAVEQIGIFSLQSGAACEGTDGCGMR